MRHFGILLLGAAVWLSGCSESSQKPPPVPPGAIPAGTVLGSATLSGRVSYAGSPKQPEAINMGSDAACHRKQEEPRREDLLVGNGGALRNTFVRVTGGLEGKHFAPPEQPVTLDQRGCIYSPHILGLQVGQQLLLVNSDPTLHNVHTVSKDNKPFNFGMAVQGQRSARYFAAPEVMVKVKCDVHPWMAAYIGVVEHPFYAVTDEDGRYAIRGLPAGRYVLEVWQETLGTLRQPVEVTDGEAKEISFTFPG